MDLPLYSEWLFCSPFAHLESGSFCGFYDLMTPVGSDQGAEMNVASCCNPSFPFSRAPSLSALLFLASRWGWSFIFRGISKVERALGW